MRKTSLKDYLFKGRKQIVVDNYFKMLNGYSPVFTTYRGGLYEMDLTRAAVHRFATMCSKLKPEISGAAKSYLEKTLQFKPNFFMDTTKFLYRLATIHEVDNTAFIIPVEDATGRLIGYYPILPQRCEIVEAGGIVYLRYQFANGEYAAIELSLIHI